jgi:diaminopimelate decarboxylase
MSNSWIPSSAEAQQLANDFSTPVFVYDGPRIEAKALEAKAFPNAFGLTVRYAMKAASNAHLLRFLDKLGLHFDASSGWEVQRLLKAGIEPGKISLSTQELPLDFADWLKAGVTVNACSLNQLQRIGEALPGHAVGVRINPGLGSGSTNRTNVGGPASSFGIWHESIPQIRAIAEKFQLKIFRIHTHIGSGSDPEVWQKVAGLSLDAVAAFPDVTTLNMGGGYKVARMPGEKSTDLQKVGAPVRQLFEDFAEKHGRRIQMEIEPGTFLVANGAGLLSRIQDICDTGEKGFAFLKLDTGMTDILRPSLYGAQHPIHYIPSDNRSAASEKPYIIVGHCCESGDILTPAPGDAEGLLPRDLPQARIGDYCWIGGAGAYCAAMSAKNYNSYPESPEVWRNADGSFQLIRKRQTLEQILQNEIPLS